MPKELRATYKNLTFFRRWGRVPDFEDKLDKLHRMLVIRGMRPDRTMIVAKEYVADALGERFVECKTFNLGRKRTREQQVQCGMYKLWHCLIDIRFTGTVHVVLPTLTGCMVNNSTAGLLPPPQSTAPGRGLSSIIAAPIPCSFSYRAY
jgi:hypothetical protein